MNWNILFTLLLALGLGLLQGCLEWIPVSSEAFLMIYLIIFLKLDPLTCLAISLFLHFSTMLTVILYFRYDFIGALKVLRSIFSTKKRDSKRNKTIFKLLVTSFIGSAISGGATYMFYTILLKTINKAFLEAIGFLTLTLIGIAMIITGFLIKKQPTGLRSIEDVNNVDGLLGGLAQGLAVIPGISRSGITLTTFLFRRFRKEDALTLSFLIYISAVILSTSYYLIANNIAVVIQSVGILFFTVALVSTFISSLMTMKSFIYLAKKLNFSRFLISIGVLIFISNLLAIFLPR